MSVVKLTVVLLNKYPCSRLLCPSLISKFVDFCYLADSEKVNVDLDGKLALVCLCVCFNHE